MRPSFLLLLFLILSLLAYFKIFSLDSLILFLHLSLVDIIVLFGLLLLQLLQFLLEFVVLIFVVSSSNDNHDVDYDAQ